MAKIQYTTFRFDHPLTLAESDYDSLKELLTQKPNYSLDPSSNFISIFKLELICICIMLFEYLLISINAPDWLQVIVGIPAFISLYSLFSFIPSFLSFLGYIDDKHTFYSRLKRDIVKSNSYNEFINLRNKRP